jgi:NAD-dependent dihydropyrimidine dehydrogenase PreA subunit
MEDYMKYIPDVSTLSLNTGRCTGCGMCTEVCPHNVFAIKDKKAVILDKDLCMECGACFLNCAFGALSVDRGVGCAVAIINSMINGGEPSCDCSGSNDKNSCC